MVESTNQILRQIRDGGATVPSLGESTNDILRQIRDAGLGGGGSSVDTTQNAQITANREDIAELFDIVDEKANNADIGTSAALDLPPDDNQLYGITNGLFTRIFTSFEMDPKPTVEGVNRFFGETEEAAIAAVEAHFALPENADMLAWYDAGELRILIIEFLVDGEEKTQFMSRVGGAWKSTINTTIKAISAGEININELIGGQELINRVTAVEEKLAAVRTYTLLLSGL